jgi:hypothetical protein
MRMALVTDTAHPKYRELAALRGLPRSPLPSYARRSRDAGAKAAWLGAYLHGRVGPRAAFPCYEGEKDQGIYPLGQPDEPVRVALAGDWGSGTAEAAAVAGTIAAGQPHFTVNLGDIYHVGDADEVRANFLGESLHGFTGVAWPRGSRGTFALNGNHDMYARGGAYFGGLLPLLGLAGGAPQRASYFCLENRHWRLIALDTGYRSVAWPLLEELPWPPFAPANDLVPAQLEWLRQVLGSDRQPKAAIVLTHHPPWSRFERAYPQPARQLAPFFSTPVLWFWGHEHRLAIYDHYRVADGIGGFGRCVGHGGMPVELERRLADPAAPLDFTDERRYPGAGALELGYNGFAQLDFEGERLMVEYRDLSGAAVYREEWRARAGELSRLGGDPCL